MRWTATSGIAALALLILSGCGRGTGLNRNGDADITSDAEADGDVDLTTDAETDGEETDGDIIGDGDIEGDAEDGGTTCGDLLCEEGETCDACPVDCGECPTCDLAPSCSGAPSVPTGSEPLDSFNNDHRSNYVCGVGLGQPASETDCLEAQLRIRLRELKIYSNGRSVGEIAMYCVIVASDGYSSEIFITPRWAGIRDDHIPLHVDVLSASFWGQAGLAMTFSNLAITYQCLESTDNSEYQAMLDGVAEAAIDAGGIAGPYGWAFGLGSIGASLLADIVGGSEDVVRLSVEQIIDEDALLELTNGRTWQIRQNSDTSDLFEDWEGMLEVEAWGCADPRPTAD